MKHSHPKNLRHFVIAVGFFVLFTIVGLWSWNTLGDLFDLPVAQYKHIVAALGLLLVLKFSLFHSHRRLTRRHFHSIS